MLAGSSDSPTWGRGKRSRSSNTTSSPWRVSSALTQEPAGPPPMTMMGGSGTEIIGYANWDRCAKALITRGPLGFV